MKLQRNEITSLSSLSLPPSPSPFPVPLPPSLPLCPHQRNTVGGSPCHSVQHVSCEQHGVPCGPWPPDLLHQPPPGPGMVRRSAGGLVGEVCVRGGGEGVEVG